MSVIADDRESYRGRSHRKYHPWAEGLEGRQLLASLPPPSGGAWTTVVNPGPSSGTGTMLLLSDGTVMVQGGGVSNTWYALKPDSSGSYADGTWSQLASMSLQRLYNASDVLPDGRVFIAGGEYSGPSGADNETNKGEIYDPVQNTWTSIKNFPESELGDAISEVLPDGNVLVGAIADNKTYKYNPTANTWTFAANMLNPSSNEETWIKLPDDSILSYDIWNNGHAERYIPSQNQWVATGSVPVNLSSSSSGYELGPAFLLPDGRAFYLGATGHTAFYTPSTDTWTAGPDIPDGMVAADVPGAMMPDGNILFAACPAVVNGKFLPSTKVFEFDPTTKTYTDVSPSGYDLTGYTFADRMLMLPTGQVLYTNGSNQLILYTPNGTPSTSWQPQVSQVTDNGDGTYTLQGTQLNGISEGASYGDDAQMDTNYPIVRLVSTSGQVFTARTYDWSSTGVATGSEVVSTQFRMPAGITSGLYDLYVIANGIPSGAWSFPYNLSNNVTVTGPTTSPVYGQSASFTAAVEQGGGTAIPTGTIQFLINGSDYGSPVTLVNGAADFSTTTLPAGDDTVSAIYSGDSNYPPGTGATSLTVDPATLTITADDASKTYGTTLAFAGTEFTVVGLLNSDSVGTVTLTSTGAATTATVAGSPYSIIPSAALGSGLNNYTITYDNGALTVNPAVLTITAKNLSKTYGQALTFAGTEFTTAGLVNGDSVSSVTLTSAGAPASATVAGSPYSIVPSAAVGTGLSNYTIAYANGALTVNTASLTITAMNASKTYGQTLSFDGTEFTTAGLVNGDTVSSVTLTSTGRPATATVAGSPYNIVPSAAVGNGLSNYTITYDNGRLTVNPAVLTITAKNASKTYGQAPTFSGTEFTAAGLVNSDTVSSVTLKSTGTTATATVALAPYPIVPSAATGIGLGNYSIIYDSGALTVNPASLTIKAKDTTKVYGQALTFAGTEFTAVGLLNADSVASVTLTSAGAAVTATVTASLYPVVPSAAVGSGLGNYTIAYGNGQLSVNPALLTITAKNGRKTYGQTLTFSGTEFTSVGLVNGDSVTSVSLASTGAAATATVAASPYPIIPAAAAGAGLGNYTITYDDGVLSVSPATLTITANNTTKTYGQTTSFDGTEFTAAGLVNVDSVTSVDLTSTGADATASVASSPYPIAPSFAVGSGLSNYTITYDDGQLSVNPAALTITADSTSKTYGQSVTFTATEFTTAGLVNGDTVSSVTITSAGAPVSATVSGSPYAIVPGAAVGSGLSNYTITYANGDLTVNPASLTITAASKSKPYGQSASFTGTEFAAVGLVNGDTVTNVTLTSAGSTASATVAGSPYSIIPSGASGTGIGNYTIAYHNGELTVNPAPLTITANSTTKTYGQALLFTGTEFTAVGLVNGDSVTTLILSSAGAVATATVAASPFPIVPRAATGTGLDNYAITYDDGVLGVSPAILTIIAKNASKTYGQTLTLAGTEFTAAGLVNGDTVSSVILTSDGSPATAAVDNSPYPIVADAAVGTGLNNYAVTYVDATLTVNPAALIITASPDSKTYGQVLTFSGAEFTSTGLLNGDTVTSVTLASAGQPARTTVAGSPYSIIPSAAHGSGLSNYAITYDDGALTVKPARLTITANSASKIYGQSLTFDGTEFSASGLVKGDSIHSVSLFSAGAPAAATVASSPYAIIPGGAVGSGLANYAIAYADGRLTVDPAPLTITADNQSKLFGNPLSLSDTAFTATGLVNGDTVSTVTLTSAGVDASATPAASPYAIIPSGAVGSGLANYTITYVAGSLTVTAPLVELAGVRMVSIKKQKLSQIIVQFSGELNPAEAQDPAIYTLRTAGKKGSFTARNSKMIALRSVSYSPASDTVTLTLKKPMKVKRPVQLQINGKAPSGLGDSLGRLIDGNHDGQPGGDAVAVLGRRGATIDAAIGARPDQGSKLQPSVIDRVLERKIGTHGKRSPRQVRST